MKTEKFQKEKDLFLPLKTMFKSKGYSVFAEVPVNYRGVDFVAVDGDDHIAVEMKLSFNYDVIRQASYSVGIFNKAYVAFPVKKPFLVHDEHYWNLTPKQQYKVDWCNKVGIGILQVLRCGTIFEALEAKECERRRIFDFQHYRESEDDEAGLPFQKGVSSAARELVGVMEYVKLHPEADWKEIYNNVQNHYSSHTSMSGSMGQWRGFNLKEYKRSIFGEPVVTLPIQAVEVKPEVETLSLI